MRKSIIAVLVTIMAALMCVCAAWAGEGTQSDADLADAAQGNNYLTFTAQENNSGVALNYKSGTNVMYSLNGGNTWNDYSEGTSITLSKAGDSVCFKGTDVATNDKEHFVITGKVAASGDVTSLADGVGGGDCEAPCCNNMFTGCTGLTSAPGLPSTVLTNGCYYHMFDGCTGLTEAPELPATTLTRSCYEDMFRGCTGLTKAPELPATTLEIYCYSAMFKDCTGLTQAPSLPATTLESHCYSSMFSGCTSLTQAPSLPATTLKQSCYSSMFSACWKLTQAPSLPATTLADACYSSMFNGCIGLTQAPSLPATTLADSCYSSMFEGCKGLTQAPNLPATKIYQGSYSSMFKDCTGLTKAPDLPATSLENSCYSSMFKGCTGLTEAPDLPATKVYYKSYSSMFSGCTGLTETPNLPARQIGQECYASMFEGCTGLTAVPNLPATYLESKCYSRMFKNCTSIKISNVATGDYTEAWSVPSGVSSALNWSADMFTGTGGTFAGSPEIGQTYYYQRRVEVTGVTLDKTTLSLGHGDQATITASVLPANASVRDVTWSSSNESVATVSDDGIVSTGLAGTAVITVTTVSGGKTASCTVTVSHNLEHHAAVAATCTTAGKSEYWYCTTCKKYFSDAAGTNEIAKDSWVINKLGHSMEHHSAVAATATTDGNSEYWYCTTCKKYYSDAAGTTEIEKDSWIIPKLGSKLVESVKLNKTSVTAGTSVTEINEKNGNPVKNEDKSLVITKASTVQLTATVSPANAVNKSLTWTSSDETIATVDKNGLVTVLRYGKATITATAADGSGASAACTVQGKFYDVNGSATKGETDYQYFYNPVYWAAELGITQGYDKVYFGVGRECTREEFVMFVWRHAGKPEAEAFDADKFTDVKKSDLSVNFKKAISWAVSKGIIKGYSDGTFGVGKAIVRKDALIMLYRYAGKPPVSVKETGYTDVDGVYEASSDTFKAIVWAKANGITTGFTASQAAAAGLTDPAFGSLQPCVREQMITFLYRYNNLK